MSSGKCLVIGVRMKPGWIELTRMFLGPSSIAADFASPRTAHFEATYGCTIGAPRSPSIDETLMIEPPPAAFICSTTACMPRKVPVRLTSMTFCHLAMSNLPIWPSATIAGVVDERGQLAERLDGDVDRGVPLLGIGDVEVDVARGVAEFVGQRLALVVEDVADDHFAALGDQRPGVRGAHAPRPAADQCHFSVHASHEASGYRTAIRN